MANVILVGAPMDCGKARKGCLMGPDAYRVAGIEEALRDLGHDVRDTGDVDPGTPVSVEMPDHIHKGGEVVAWTRALAERATAAMDEGLPIFMGGDHALAAGTVTGVAAHAKTAGQPQFVLWLDAHTDFHSVMTTGSGNLHGTPLAYATGQDGFPGFPPVTAPIPLDQVAAIGLRSVDAAEKAALRDAGAHQNRRDSHALRQLFVMHLVGGALRHNSRQALQSWMSVPKGASLRLIF